MSSAPRRSLRWAGLGACVVGLAIALPRESTAKPQRASAKTAETEKPKREGHASKEEPRRASTSAIGAKRARTGDKKKTNESKSAKKSKPPEKCLAAPVKIERSELKESVHVSLTDCKGRPLLKAQESVSALARRRGTRRPSRSALEGASGGGDRVSDGAALLDAGLLTRLQAIVDHFGGSIDIVSGFRPQSEGSLHQRARALDIRVKGVTNEDLVAYCRTLDDTGCGYYPNSTFVHVDVRAKGSGHVTWIDASGPGERPRYVSSWPEGRPSVTASPPADPATADAPDHND
jgi:hypothetical protein